MSSERTVAMARTVYDKVNVVLWATVTAFVIYLAVFVAPNLPGRIAAERSLRSQEVAAEDAAYCTKWRMGPGTPMHNECLADLRELRTRIENRFVDENVF
jgi:hypothetical protein